MIRIRTPWAVAIVCASLWISGCGPPALFQVETVIHPDGSCDRSIWQPSEEMLPEGAMSPAWKARWQAVADVAIPPAFAKQNQSPGDRPYFHAHGSFRNPMEIPAHFLKRIEGHPEVGTSELVRSYERKDYGFVVAHHWREKITNIVTRDGFLKARDQLLDLGVPMFNQAVQEIYGGEYDVKPLVDELRTRGRPFLEDAMNVYYDWMADPASEPAVFEARFVAALQRAGVDFHDAGDVAGSRKETWNRIQEYLHSMIDRDVKRKDGRPLAEADFQAFLDTQSSPSYRDAWKKFGNDHKEEFEAKLVPLVLRMTGLYNYPPIFQGPVPEFVFRVRLPGLAVTTNGTTDDSGQITWSFNGGRLFPDGFEMKAESLDIDRQAQTRLLGRIVIADPKTAQAFHDLVSADEFLADLVRRSCQAGDSGILRDAHGKDDQERARLDKLKELLQLTR